MTRNDVLRHDALRELLCRTGNCTGNGRQVIRFQSEVVVTGGKLQRNRTDTSGARTRAIRRTVTQVGDARKDDSGCSVSRHDDLREVGRWRHVLCVTQRRGRATRRRGVADDNEIVLRLLRLNDVWWSIRRRDDREGSASATACAASGAARRGKSRAEEECRASAYVGKQKTLLV